MSALLAALMDAPEMQTRPWTSAWTLQWIPNQDLDEYFCDDYNRTALRTKGKWNAERASTIEFKSRKG